MCIYYLVKLSYIEIFEMYVCNSNAINKVESLQLMATSNCCMDRQYYIATTTTALTCISRCSVSILSCSIFS